MVDQNLAGMSDALMGSSMLVYAGAFLAYATDLGNLGARRTRIRTAPKQLVGAGAGASPPEVVVDLRDDVGPLSVHDGPPASTLRRRAAGIATALTWLAFVLHLGSVVTRGLSAGRPPWGNMYEFSLTGSCVVTAVYLMAIWRNPQYRVLGAFAVGPVILTLGAAALLFYTVSARLVPALQSGFLVVHVTVAFISTALFTLAFSAHILQLLKERREQRAGASKASFMDRLPGSDALENLGFRLVAISFPLWTFTLVAGAIWAQKAWSRYWGWDPKEVWTFVVWVVYAAYLHARATRGWNGRRATWIAIAGFVCILINYTIVNIYFSGMHSYSGIG